MGRRRQGRRPIPSAERTSDVIVIGGGIHGCSAALHLARRGLSVRLIEKDHVARHASGVNAGGVRRLGRDIAEVPLSVRATEYWHDIEALVDDDCGYRKSCHLKVALSEAELDTARRRAEILRQQGFSHEQVIDRETLREIVPAATEACVGALHVDGDGAALPFRTTQAFARRAATLGVNIHEATPVTDARRRGPDWRVETAHGSFTAGALINAAGAWGGKLAGMLGDRVALEAHAPMLAITAPLPRFIDAVVGCEGRPLSLKQFENGTVLIGGGVRGVALPERNLTRLDMAGLGCFLTTAATVFPHLANASIVRSWAGIEGYTPDNLPVLGQGSAEGVVHSFGYSAHGFQLAPATGEIVADLITGTEPQIDLEPFRPGRFGAH